MWDIENEDDPATGEAVLKEEKPVVARSETPIPIENVGGPLDPNVERILDPEQEKAWFDGWPVRRNAWNQKANERVERRLNSCVRYNPGQAMITGDTVIGAEGKAIMKSWELGEVGSNLEVPV